MGRKRNTLAPKRNEFIDANVKNVSTYQLFYDRMRNLCLSLYEWEGLPKTCDARHLEKVLFYSGLAGFAKDDRIGWISLAALPTKKLNMYNEALAYTLDGTNYHKTFSLDNVILCRNNLTRTPTVWAVQQYAERIANAFRTIDINIAAQKTPVLIVCDEKQKLTMKNVYMQYEGGYPVIYGDKLGFSPDSVRVLTTDAPYLADKLMDHVNALWADFLTYIGINSVGTEKRERLISDEVNANNEHISLAASTGLLTRQKAAEELSAACGQKVTVRMRTYDRDIDGNPMEPEEPEPAEKEDEK